MRSHSLDGAVFPHVITAEFNIGGMEYKASKWIKAGITPPTVGDKVCISYNPENPCKAEIKV